jgi:hypothetical protein
MDWPRLVRHIALKRRCRPTIDVDAVVLDQACRPCRRRRSGDRPRPRRWQRPACHERRNDSTVSRSISPTGRTYSPLQPKRSRRAWQAPPHADASYRFGDVQPPRVSQPPGSRQSKGGICPAFHYSEDTPCAFRQKQPGSSQQCHGMQAGIVPIVFIDEAEDIDLSCDVLLSGSRTVETCKTPSSRLRRIRAR